MRIGAIVNRSTAVLQYQARDLLWGFAQNGHEALLEYDDEINDGEAIQKYLESLDVFLAVSAGRWQMKSMVPDKTAVWTYDQDNITMELTGDQVPETDKIFALLPRWAEALRARGVPAHHLPPGVNTDYFYPDHGQRADTVVFLGNHYPGRDTSILEQMPPDMRKWMTEAYNAFRSDMPLETDPDDALLEYLNATRVKGVPRWDGAALAEYLHPMARKEYQVLCHYWHRQKWIGDLVDLLGERLRLYGKGWEQWPDNNEGSVEPGPQSAEIMRRAGCVLYLHPLTASHPRLFEAAACAAPIVAGPTSASDLRDHFDESQVLDGTSPEEVAALAEGVLNGNYSAMGDAAAARVAEAHTYAHRAKQMEDA